MKVLHLPFNVASQMSVSVRALRSLGVRVRGLARQFSVIQDCTGLETVDWSGRPSGLARLTRSLRWRFQLSRAVSWADLIHWHWGESSWKGTDLFLIRMLRKPALVEFWGDDLRDPATASRDNPYIARMYKLNPDLMETPCGRWLKRFANNRFECLIGGYELADYLSPRLFTGYYQTHVRLCLEDFTARPPDPTQHRPLVVHAPSNKARKGTEAVLRAVEALRSKYDFDFQLIQNVPRAKALDMISQCDVFLDQFTVGAEGLAAHEAMALAKPVVCFIKPSIRPRYPDDFPVVCATQESLSQVLPGLLRDGLRRHQLGLRGRAYVEKHNNAIKVAREHLEIYEDLRAFRRGTSTTVRARCQHWRSLPPRRSGGEHA